MPLDFGNILRTGVQGVQDVMWPNISRRQLQEQEQAGIQKSRGLNDTLTRIKMAGGLQTPDGRAIAQNELAKGPELQKMMTSMGGEAFGRQGAFGAIPQAQTGFEPTSYRTGPEGAVSGATFGRIDQPEATASDATFYTDRGYSEDEAKTILDKKFGLEEPGADRTAKDIAMDIGRWQSIYNRTREVGILGTFGDIFDQEMADLATGTLDELRAELTDIGTNISTDKATRKTTILSSEQEIAFQSEYAKISKELGLNPNPDDPKHFYNYRGLFKETGSLEVGPQKHFPSKYKLPGHPNLVVDGINTKTGVRTDTRNIQIPAPPGDVDAVTGAERRAVSTPSTKVKMRNKKGVVFNVLGKEVNKWEKKGFVAEDGLTRDKRGWIHFTAPDGTLTWVNPKDISLATERGYKPVK